jgi:hypothetical protein
MNAANTGNGTSLADMRQKLVLAQVQLLELTDAREGLLSRVEQSELALSALQSLTDQALADQQQTKKIADALKAEIHQLTELLSASRLAEQNAQVRISELSAILERAGQTAAALLVQVSELEAINRQLKSSRSWRWTAPLRSIERFFSKNS